MSDLLSEFLQERTAHEAAEIRRVYATRRLGSEVLTFNRHNVTFDAASSVFTIDDELDPARPPETVDASELIRLLGSG